MTILFNELRLNSRNHVLGMGHLLLITTLGIHAFVFNVVASTTSDNLNQPFDRQPLYDLNRRRRPEYTQ